MVGLEAGQSMNVVFHMWSFWVFVAVLFVTIRGLLNPDPRKIISDHVVYIHATLGMGKTALAAHWVRSVLARSWVDVALARVLRRQLALLPVVYSTFELVGAEPLDLRSGVWPSTRGAKIVIDELLLLESNDLVPLPWFSRGCTLARQLGQQVCIISQASRLPNRLRKFQGTVGLWVTMKGVSFGKRGRLVIVKRATEPFVRRTKGFKAEGQKTSLVWVPGVVFAGYNSRKIYGYTVDLDGSWLDLEAASNAVGVDNQGAAHVPPTRSEAGAAHAPKKPRVHRVKRAA